MESDRDNATRARELRQWGPELIEVWAKKALDEADALRDRVATLERDLADARAKLGQAWDEGWRDRARGYANTSNPYAPAGEKEL